MDRRVWMRVNCRGRLLGGVSFFSVESSVCVNLRFGEKFGKFSECWRSLELECLIL